MRLPGYCIWLPLLLMGFAARADIYRCSGEFGEPTFSQLPCGGDSTIAVRQAPSGEGPATGLRPSERAWLDRRDRESRRGKVKKRKPRVTQAAAKTAAATQAYRCRSKRRSLDEVKAKLRRGYKPASGERLRRRRRAYEDYLSTFCS